MQLFNTSDWQTLNQQFNNWTPQHFNNSTLQQSNASTLQQFNKSTIQQCNNSTFQQFNHLTIHQIKNSTIQQFNNSTIQPTTIQTKKNSSIGPKKLVLCWLSLAQLSPLLFAFLLLHHKNQTAQNLVCLTSRRKLIKIQNLTKGWRHWF